MVHWVVEFGPDQSFFFNSPTQWSHHGLPQALTDIIQKEAAEIHDMALGPDGAFTCIYANRQGRSFIHYQNAPQGLIDWLIPVKGGSASPQRDMKSLRIALGPNGSFFAFDNNGSQWCGIPDGMLNAINANLDANRQWTQGNAPKSVSIGANGTFFFLRQNLGATWAVMNTEPQGKQLEDWILNQKQGCTGISGVRLSPVRTDLWYVVFDDGRTWASICDDHTPNSNNFTADLKAGVIAANQAAANQQAQLAAQQQQQALVRQQHESRKREIITVGMEALKPLLAIGIAAMGGGGA